MAILNWSPEGDEVVLLARLKDNIEALKETGGGDKMAAFLEALHGKFVETQDGDWRAKMLAANRSLTLQNEAARSDTSRDRHEMKALRDENKALKEALAVAQPEEHPAEEPEEQPESAGAWPVPGAEIELAPETPAPETPCTCAPSDSELIAYVRAIAERHGMDAQELSINITASGSFLVANTVPQRGRVRSRVCSSLDEAVGSLRHELTTM